MPASSWAVTTSEVESVSTSGFASPSLIQAAPLMQMPVFLVLFFAPVYVPHELLEGWIKSVATVNPQTYLVETGRGFFAGDPPHALGTFALAIGLGVAFWWWAFLGLRRAEAAGA